MSIYAGLDVSDKTTHICVVDVEGKVLRRDVVASDPDVLAKWRSTGFARISYEWCWRQGHYRRSCIMGW
jgi:hypothetical protein